MVSPHDLIRTFTYFDLFDYPLTSLEAWKFLHSETPATFEEVHHALHEVKGKMLLDMNSGFWHLPGRRASIGIRHERYRIAERKYRRALWATRLLKWVPGIRMVAVVNTLALNYARDGSDIDFFIVTRPGALWSSRLLGVFPFALLGLRPRRGRERDLFCFSFFVSETALDFSRFRIAEDDPYLLYWLASMVPLYDPDGLMEAVWDENQWIRQTLPNGWPASPGTRRQVRGSVSRHGAIDKRMSVFEHVARMIQMLWLPRTLTALMNIDGRVIVTDEILKFHENDRREEIYHRYKERCEILCG